MLWSKSAPRILRSGWPPAERAAWCGRWCPRGPSRPRFQRRIPGSGCRPRPGACPAGRTRCPPGMRGSPLRSWRAGSRSGRKSGCACSLSRRRRACPRGRRCPSARDAGDGLHEGAVEGKRTTRELPQSVTHRYPLLSTVRYWGPSRRPSARPLPPNVAILFPSGLHRAILFAPYSEMKRVPSSASAMS